MKFDAETTKLIEQTMEDLLKSRGRINILIAGNTGVGKSTLVNAVFNGKIATTGQGKPITQGIKKRTKDGIPVAIYDTQGFELKNFKDILKEQEKFVRERNAHSDWRKHIHIVWLCISDDSKRVQDGEQEFLKTMAKHVPCVGVITKARSDDDDGFKATVEKLLPQTKVVLRVLAEPETIKVAGQAITIPAHGLKDLVEVTMDLVPEETRDAFASAQKVDLDAKMKRARVAIKAAAGAAAAAASLPLPMSGALALAPIQVGMFFAITRIFGLHFAVQDFAAIFGAAFGVTGATLVGRELAGAILKTVAPGPGSATAAAINGSVAFAITMAIGEAFAAALYALYNAFQAEAPKMDDVIKLFKTELKSRTIEAAKL